jgi:hypothetical protein
MSYLLQRRGRYISTLILGTVDVGLSGILLNSIHSEATRPQQPQPIRRPSSSYATANLRLEPAPISQAVPCAFLTRPLGRAAIGGGTEGSNGPLPEISHAFPSLFFPWPFYPNPLNCFPCNATKVHPFQLTPHVLQAHPP